MDRSLITTASVRARATAGAILLLLAFALSMIFGGRAEGQATGQAVPACPQSLVPNGHDYHGLPLVLCSFAGQDLTNANFNGATLTGVVFIKTNLTGADFSGATFADSGNASLPTDFTFANLTNARFVSARFDGTTYLTHATLTCADFSQTHIDNGNAIFGDAPLVIDTSQNCRTKFRNTTMNCEFVAQWNLLDLTGADLSACNSRLATPGGTTAGHDFSGGIYRNVVFDGLDLRGSTWKNAVVAGASFQGSTLDGATGLSGSDLTLVVFTQASLKGVDLSGALLYGTVFDGANLDKARLRGAYLSPCPAPAKCVAASLRGAWLRNVDLSGSHLENAVFNSASFYGTVGAGNGSCDTASGNCASANGATLTSTNFTDAYLFGVDFGNAQMHGAIFDGAVLVAANFAGATVAPEPNRTNGSFANAFLQGANLGGAVLDGVTFSGAFFDFSASGNTMLIRLNSNHTRFAGWGAKDQPVCTRVTYGASASVPPSQTVLACPDNTKPSPVNGCGPASPTVPSTSHWNNHSSISTNDPAASYRFPATFTPQSADLCQRNLAW